MRKSDCRVDQTHAHVCGDEQTRSFPFSSHCCVQFVSGYLLGWRWQVVQVECTMRPGVELFWKKR